MGILATRRKWVVTRRWGASGSSCSRQRLASMYSSSGASIGNLRISRRYRPRFPSVEMLGRAEVVAMALRSLPRDPLRQPLIHPARCTPIPTPPPTLPTLLSTLPPPHYFPPPPSL